MLKKINISSILSALRECSCSRNLKRGKDIHRSVVQESIVSVFVANSLIDMYAKCGSLKDARLVFHGIETPTVVSWNNLILGYADNGEAEMALRLFVAMEREGQAPDARTFVAVVKACTNLACVERGKAINMLASICSFDSHVFVANTLVGMYSKCGSLHDALTIFNNINVPDVVAWTSLILGFADSGKGEMALELFSKMVQDGCFPDAKCIVAVLKACTSFSVKEEANRTLQRAKALQLLAFCIGCDSSIHLGNMLITVYGKCGSMGEAHKSFENMHIHNVVGWNALILGYGDDGESVTGLFFQMHREGCVPDVATFLSVLKACSKLWRGQVVHLLASCNGVDSHSFVEGTLLHMYLKFNSMDDARRVFNNMKDPNVMIWTALILGYAENGEGLEALSLFMQMERRGCAADSTAFAAALRACSVLGSLELGKVIHTQICTRGFENDEVLATCLVHFYAKCGSLIDAERVFNGNESKRDLVTWTALIAGYTRVGDFLSVFSLLTRMLDVGLRPDGATFSCILTACNHAGLVDKGKYYYEIMSKRYGIIPDLEHCTCMVDMLGRANKLDEAMVLLRNMPFTSDAVPWMTLMGACRKWKNVRLGNLAFEESLRLDERSSGAYIMLADISGVDKK